MKRPETRLLAALAAILVGVTFLPTVPSLAGGFLGIDEVDHFGTQWFYGFVEDAVRHGKDLFWTDLLFFPYGKDIYRHTGANLLDAVAALPFRVLLGPVLGYNAFVLAGLLFNAWAFHRLARDRVADPFARGVATLLFALSPYILYETAEGRPMQSILGLLPLFLREAWRAAERPGWRAPVLGGVLLAVLGYWYWFYAFFAGLAAAALLGWTLLLRYLVMAGIAVALVAPVAVPLLLASSAADSTVPGLLDTARWTWLHAPPITREGHEIALLVWQPLAGKSGFYFQDERGEVLLAHQLQPLWVSFLLVALWLWRPGPVARGPILAMTAVLSVLALGPFVLLPTPGEADLAIPNPLYIGAVHAVRFLRRLWWPGRAVAVLLPLGGLVVAAVVARLGEGVPRRKLVAAGILGALVLGQMLWSRTAPFPTWSARIPAGYRCLAAGAPGAVFELPYGWTQAHLYYQSVHGRPIFGGMLERNPVFQPPEHVTLREANTFVKALLEAYDKEPRTDVSEVDAQALRDMGYRYVLLQKDALRVHVDGPTLGAAVTRTRLRQTTARLDSLLGTPVWNDARVALWGPWGDPSPCADAPPEKDTEPAPWNHRSTASVKDLDWTRLRILGVE